MPNIKKTVGFSIIALAFLFLPFKPLFAAELTGLSLSPAQLTIEAGKTSVFTVTASYSNGTSSIVTEDSTFKLDGGGFTGMPSKKGEFEANAQGKWTLTALFENLTATASITITHGPAVKLNFLPTQADLTADGFLPIRAFAVDANGNGWDVTPEASFSTTDPTGTVTADGYTPHTAGSWIVSAAYQGFSGSFTADITPGMLKTLTIEPETALTADPGDEVNYVAKGLDAKGNQVTSNVEWKTSNNKVAKITKTGKLTAGKTGQTNVIAEADGVQAVVPILVSGETAITNQTTDIVSVQKPNQPEKNPRVAAEEVEKVPVQEQRNLNTEKTESSECKNIAHPWVIILILLQVVALTTYFTWQLKKPMRLWWIAPVVLTAVLLIIYSQLFCDNTYLWWPWTTLGISVIFISVYYQRLGLHDGAPPGDTKA